MVTSEGPVALTALGRLLVEGPQQVIEAPFGASDSVIVQADLTVLAPPDLDPALAARLRTLARLESHGGANLYRLDEAMIIRALQGEDDPDSIIDFLASLSSAPLADTVKRLVLDAADRVGKVTIMTATTVVITTDPADLTTACSIKGAKLRKVSPTVAVSDLAAVKVRTALDKKGLSPQLVLSAGDRPAPRRSVEQAQALAARAQEVRALAERTGSAGYRAHAEQLERSAAALNDISARLQVDGPLALSPALLARLTDK